MDIPLCSNLISLHWPGAENMTPKSGPKISCCSVGCKSECLDLGVYIVLDCLHSLGSRTGWSGCLSMALWGFAEQIKSTFVLFRIGLRARQNVHAVYQNVQLTHLYQPDIVHTQTLHCLGLSDSLKFLNRLEMDHLSTLLCNFDLIVCSILFWHLSNLALAGNSICNTFHQLM